MKKAIALILVLALALPLAACGGPRVSSVSSSAPSSDISNTESIPPTHATASPSRSDTAIPLPHITEEKTELVIDYRIPDLSGFFSDEQRDLTLMRSLHMRDGVLTYTVENGSVWTLRRRQHGNNMGDIIMYESDVAEIGGTHLRGFLPISDTQYLLEVGTEVSPGSGRTAHPSVLFILNIQDGSLVPAKQYYGYDDDYVSYVAKIDDTLYIEAFSFADDDSVTNVYRKEGFGQIQKLDTPTLQPYDDFFVTESGAFICTAGGTLYGAQHNEGSFGILLTFRHKGYSVLSIHGNHLFLEINLDEPGESNHILKINILTAMVESVLVFSRHDEFIPNTENVHVIHSTISDGSDGREPGSIAFTQFCVFDWDGNLLLEYPPLETPGVLWAPRYAIYDDTLYCMEFDGIMDILKQSEPLETFGDSSPAA